LRRASIWNFRRLALAWLRKLQMSIVTILYSATVPLDELLAAMK
jgi:hypothetical protein